MTSRFHSAGRSCWAAVMACAVLAAGIAGCGSNSPTMSDPPGSGANITGNWVFTANAGASGIEPISIYLASNAGSASGIAVLPPEPQICVAGGFCGGPLTVMNTSLTGTIDASGNLTLGSTAPGGVPVFAMAGTVSGTTMSNGSFTLTGTEGTISQGSVAGVEYAALDGTYSGTVTSASTGQSFTVSALLNQSNGPNSSGLLGLTGTMTITGDSCVPSSAMAISTSFVGSGFQNGLNVTSSETLGVSGTLSPSGKTLAIQYGLSGASGSCSGDSAAGTLTLQ